MADRAKHAFGALERVDENIASGKLDAFDVLFVKDADGKPYVGWVDKEGNKVICDNETDLSGIEAELANKANVEFVEELESKILEKADATDVAAIEAEMANKVDAPTVQSMIEKHSSSVIEVIEF